jgi:hypothetical protein
MDLGAPAACGAENCICIHFVSPSPSPTNSEGVKHDAEKLDWNLLPLKTLEAVVRVLMHGAKKYAPDNWKKVQPASRYFAAALRHLVDYQAGTKKDEETGESHLAHAIACLVFLLWHDEARK